MKTLDVLGTKITIKKIEGLTAVSGHDGEYHPDENLIIMDNKLKGNKALHTLIHELGHAIFGCGGLYTAHISPDAEEIICEQFANVLIKNFKITFR